MVTEVKQATKAGLWVLLAAAIAVTVCSRSSPLYPFNDWVDANCFLTMGRSMLHGLVPYRDLFEHKGPILYMVHALAALISDSSFLGVWLVEIAAAAAYLWVSYRLMQEYCPERALFWVPVVAVLTYTAGSFSQGDSAEELCLPILAYTLWVGLRNAKQKTVPSDRECFLVGAAGGVILWVKFTLLGMFPAWAVVPVVSLILQKNWRELLRKTGAVLAGVAAVSLPVLLYFAIHGALGDLFTVYFYNNLFLYGNTGEGNALVGVVINVWDGLNAVLWSDMRFCLLAVMALAFFLLTRRWSECAVYLLCLAFTGILVYAGGRYYFYYAFVFALFQPMGLVAVDAVLFRGDWLSLKEWMAGVECLICAALCFRYGPNVPMMQTAREEMPQFQFAQVIRSVEDPTLLNYNFMDGGFYTASGVVPECKYFFKSNLPLSEAREVQEEWVREGRTDFVVTRSEDPTPKTLDCYDIVKQTDAYDEGVHFYYTLYARKNLLPS